MTTKVSESDLSLYDRLVRGSAGRLSSYIKDEQFMANLSNKKQYNLRVQRNKAITRALTRTQSAQQMVHKIVQAIQSKPTYQRTRFRDGIVKMIVDTHPHAVRETNKGLMITARGSNAFALLSLYLHGYKIAV
jgi:hypothetical protein